MGNALQDKTVLVIGRGSGIARAVALLARSTMGPSSSPVTTPPSRTSTLAARWSMPRSLTRGPITWVNPPAVTAITKIDAEFQTSK